VYTLTCRQIHHCNSRCICADFVFAYNHTGLGLSFCVWNNIFGPEKPMILNIPYDKKLSNHGCAQGFTVLGNPICQ